MAQEYSTYLAAAVLNDGRFISYRLLSRELKVHSNVAKRMLYDFHKKQNAKRSGSVHATYLLDGIPKPILISQPNGNRQDGEDAHMQSSPFMSSAVSLGNQEEDAVPSRSIVLAREEDLEAAKARLESIQSIHIYSLQPSTLQNLQVLSDCNRNVSTQFANEDPLVAGPLYGVIHNIGVRRRTAKRPLGVAPAIAPAAVAIKSVSKALENKKTSSKIADPSSQESVKSDAKSEPPGTSGKKLPGKSPALKKEQSDIFKSFSKPKSKLKQEETASSSGDSPASKTHRDAKAQQDEPMKGVSDDDDEEQEENFVAINKADEKSKNARSERAEQLRRMMEDDDKEMEDRGDETPDDSQDSAAAIDKPSPPKEPTPEPPPPVVQGGRRRGRRKVMKKKTVKDEEGYLVTREEPAWESFSEDEPAPAKERGQLSSAASSKGKSSTAKPGQGNIMSFFGRK